GAMVINPWVDLPGNDNGLMRGSLYVDRSGAFGGDLIVVTTVGEVWRITAAGVPKRIAALGGTHLGGGTAVPNAPARFGPLAGRILAGAEEEHVVYAFAADGSYDKYSLGIDPEDIDIVEPHENFFGVDFGGLQLLGAPADVFKAVVGDIMIT